MDTGFLGRWFVALFGLFLGGTALLCAGGEDWKLPEGVNDPEGWIAKGVELVFESGMPDPRGLEYRHVKVAEGGGIREGRGWVLPFEVEQEKRLVIGWSGLIYPVEGVGEKADLEKDIETLKRKGRFGEEPFDNHWEESFTDLVARFGDEARMMHSFAAPYLLLRLGVRVEVVVRRDDPFEDGGKEEEPFGFDLPLSKDDLDRVLFDFALHVRSDGVAAFYDREDGVVGGRLKFFDELWKAALERNPDLEKINRGDDPFNDPFYGFFVPDLNAGWRELMESAGLKGEDEGEGGVVERAILSWGDLEEWDERNLPESFRAVVAEGGAAIEPLLKCLEGDERWTRTLSDVESGGWPIRVREIAMKALVEVLKFRIFNNPSVRFPPTQWFDEAGRMARGFCGRYPGLIGPELWYEVLKDGEASLSHQVEAATVIVVPEKKRSSSGIFDVFFVEDWFEEHYLLEEGFEDGNPLRDGREPSVGVLLERLWERERKDTDRRLQEGVPEAVMLGYPGGTFVYARFVALWIIRLSERWESGNLQLLKKHYDWLDRGLRNLKGPDRSMAQFILMSVCEEILVRRFWSGDEAAMQDFLRLWDYGFGVDCLPTMVIRICSDVEGMDDLIAANFLGEKARLSFRTKEWERSDDRKGLVHYSSLRLPSLRKALVEGLQNQKQQGELFEEEGVLMMRFLSDGKNKAEAFYPEGDLRGEGLGRRRIEIRMCDLIANALSPGSSVERWIVPDFRLDDPVEKRDEMIGDWIKLLEAER